MEEPRPPAIGGGEGAHDPDGELANLRTTVESLMDAVVITSPDLQAPGPIIEYVNPAFCSMTGYTSEELIGLSPRVLQGPLTDRATLDRLLVDLESRQVFSGLAINYRKDGSHYPVEWLIAPVRDGAGEVIRWVSVQRDVSERERMQARELVLLGELQRKVREVLGAVRAVVRETGENSCSVEDYWSHLDGRLVVMSRMAARVGQGAIDLQNLFLDEFHSHRLGEDSFSLTGPDVALHPDAAQAIALSAHELTVNAIKFGALTAAGGKVKVDWRVDDGAEPPRLHLQWREVGGVLTDAPGPPGYGWAYLQRQAPRQLGGICALDLQADGLAWTIDFPLAPPRSPGRSGSRPQASAGAEAS